MDDTISVQVLAQTQTRQRRRIRYVPTYFGGKKIINFFGEEQLRYKMESRNLIGYKRQNFSSSHTSPSLDIVVLSMCSALSCSALLRPHRKRRSFGEKRAREREERERELLFLSRRGVVVFSSVF